MSSEDEWEMVPEVWAALFGPGAVRNRPRVRSLPPRATGDGFGVLTAAEILALPDIPNIPNIPDVPEGVVSEYVRRVEDGAVVLVAWHPASGCVTAGVVG